MKHSSSSSMSEACEVKAMMPCNGNWNNILRSLYVDLFNLIVESRTPGINERGYGNGYHCPPLLGQNVHLCDLMKPECQKHQTMMHHLLRAVRHNVFEIEVLMLPDCCSDSKLSERIQNKEYVLLERWSMSFLESDQAQFSIEIPDLLRAVHSFLHFSQISAWLSSTKGKSPTNIYYRVKPVSDPSSTQFENSPEVHSFPLFKVNDELCGTVKVNYPTRKQYIPIIPCSKHPPLEGLRLRLTEDVNLAPIPLNQQIVKHLQKNCDNQQTIIAVKHCATDSDPLKINSTTVLKKVTHIGSDINKSNRILKHSNSWIAVKNTNGIISNSCGAQISNRNKISSKSEATLFNSYRQTYSKCSSQENLCFDKLPLTTLLSKNESELNKGLLSTFCETNSVPVEIAHQNRSKPNVPKCSSITSDLSSSDMCNISSNVSNSLSIVEPSQSSISNFPINSNSFFESQKNSFRKSLKRKHFLGNELHIIPNKKVCLCKEKYGNKEVFYNKLLSVSCQSNDLKEPSKRKHCQSLASPKKASKLVNCVQVKNCNGDKLINDEWNNHDSSKSASLGRECISLERKAMGEKSKQSSENCSNQTWNDFSNKVSRERNLKLTNTFVKLKLVNLPEQTDCTNEIISKNVNPDNRFSSNCDNLISAKFAYDASKHFSSKVNLKGLRPLKSSYTAMEVLMQDCKNHLNTRNETVINFKGDFRKSLKTYNVSNDVTRENVSTGSNKSYKRNGSQIQNGKIKKRYINDFYKSCRFPKLDLHQCSNHEAICSLNLNKKQDKNFELFKSPTASSSTINQTVSSYFNISSAKVSKPSLLDRIFKNETKGTSKSRLQNRRKSAAKSSLFDLNQEKKAEEPYLKCQIMNSFAQNQISAEKQDSKIDISKHSLLKSSSDNLLDSSSYQCDLGDKKEIYSFKASNLVYNFQDPSKNKVAQLILDARPHRDKKSDFSCNSSRNVLPQKATPYLDCFPRHKLKFARGRKLLGNFEESILKGCLLPVSNVKGFHTEIGASGSFCPNHITLPADVSFYDMDNLHCGTSPYMANVTLGDIEYYVPKKGAVQVTLFNPSETVVKMFVLNYDLSDMPPLCHTFIRQKTYYMPVGSMEDCPSSPKWLRFILHLRFASSKTGKLYLHKDFKIVVLNKSNDDAASEFNQEPRELRSFLYVPMNPTFSNF